MSVSTLMRRLSSATFWTIFLGTLAVQAQVGTTPSLGHEFEVASIKSAAPGERGTFIRPTPGGRVSITNMTLRELVIIAWRLQPNQVSGGPAWIDSARYDISAKAENSFKDGELPLMLQSLLA